MEKLATTLLLIYAFCIKLIRGSDNKDSKIGQDFQAKSGKFPGNNSLYTGAENPMKSSFISDPGQAIIIPIQESMMQLLNTPNNKLSWGAKILKFLLSLNLQLLNNVQFHSKGNYCWLEFYSCRWFELVLCFWLPGIAKSGKHDHFNSWNCTLILVGNLVAKLYHISGDNFYVYQRDTVSELEVITTPRWQAHSISNPFDRLAISLHFYTAKRPSPNLQLEHKN